MQLSTHLLSIATGTVVSSDVISSGDLPDSKSKLIALGSSILVQTIILALVELRKLIEKRKNRKKTPVV